MHFSHKDSMVLGSTYMTRVLHTARISDVDSVMFFKQNKLDGKV